MKKFLYFFILPQLTIAPLLSMDYEVDFVIHNTPTTTGRVIEFKDYNFEESTKLREKEECDEDNSVPKGSVALPHQIFTVKAQGKLPEKLADSDAQLKLITQDEKKNEKLSSVWQKLVFSVKNKQGLPDEDVILYWAPGVNKIFGEGHGENVYLSVMYYDFHYLKKKKLKKYFTKIMFFDKF